MAGFEGRYTVGEEAWAIGDLPTGGTVTIDVYDSSDGSSVGLDSDTCTEIGTTGKFYWDTSDMTNTPGHFAHYTWIMTDSDSGRTDWGTFALHGYPEKCEDLSFTGSDVNATLDGESVTIDATSIDNIWEEAISDHSGTVGSVAESLNDVDDNTDDLETRLTAARAGYLDNLNIGEDVAGVSDISGLNDPTAASIADAVWDEASGDHTAAGTTGLTIRNIDTGTDNLESRLTAARAGYLDNLNIGEDVAGVSDISGLNDPTAASIADAVWDETLADHAGAGSTGEALEDADATADVDAIADAVWDETLGDHTGAGSTGKALDDASGSSTLTAQDIWEYDVSGVASDNYSGKLLYDTLQMLITGSLAPDPVQFDRSAI